MGMIGTLIGYVLTAFILLMLARVVLDWLGVLGNSPDRATKAREVTHRATEPVIAPVRRFLQPIRAGGLSIDLAFTAVFIVALVLRAVAFSL